MRRLFLHINVSADGYITDRAGDIDWHFADQEFQAHIDALLESIDGMVFGRTAFEQLADYWPTAGDEVSATQRRRMNELPKYVLSRTLRETKWDNSHLLGDYPATALTDLKRQDGRDLALFAGGKAATSAIRLGVLDELRLVVNPVLLGGGTPLFDGTYRRHDLRLTDSRRFASGALLNTYDLVPETP
ncbi:dihydrofolate reductase [Actinomadura pelletieri DSM 43383]|uniref:Dihydrofolate reductase n=1 Tax=Actinomadura pelletieri DSM 43383 TaxID=1120940 RepID=A0A495QTQ5_9ACTN|nr:dihydrofolate reductase family protein [Actinomadura pelletieri]RKS76912.1 dihydrofolate reductase [Actinomadura pelletieri DSM 43383]